MSDEMNMVLQAPYHEEEVKSALSQMHPIKAPGPDGMCPMFFQTYWHIVRPSVSFSVLKILRGERIPDQLNHTYITLIPKKSNAISMPDFRPISLCNVIYKLVSKVLANRLKTFLDKIVSVNQSAFTPGRLITDNILVAFELFHHMKQLRSNEGCMAMKLDMSKAYDRIEWEFLDVVLMRFGFDTGWRNRVMDCVRSVTFSVLINGRPSDVFTPNRGLRQGDPLSPYLFILCAEVFSHLLRRSEEVGSLRGVKLAPTAPSINHLLFADDCIIFSKASVQDAGAIQTALSLYELSSGQKVNFDKTTISFSRGVPSTRKESISHFLGVKEVDIHDRYLGLPTVVGRSKKVIMRGVKEKLWKKLQGWKGMVLSKAGREVMIKAVAQSLPTYAMSVFKFPSSFCDEMRSLISQFWWGQKNGERKIHWVAWKKLCRPKEEGGIGFKDMKMFNWALLGKQAWRLLMHQESLVAQVLKAKYFPNASFMEAELGAYPSYTWRGIWEARWVLKRGLRWRVENGESIKVWKDAWIPGSRRVISPIGDANPNLEVGVLINPITRTWDVNLVSQLFLPFEQERVLSIPLSLRFPDDVLCWDLEKDGAYSVRSAYTALVNDEWFINEGASSSTNALWKKIWSAKVMPRVKIFAWRACLEALPTKSGLHRRVAAIDPACGVCGAAEDVGIHALLLCGLARGVWEVSDLDYEAP